MAVTPEQDAGYYSALGALDTSLRPSTQEATALVDRAARAVYHHTNNSFTVFDRSRARKSMDIDGFFFTPENDPYNEYGKRVVAAYLNIKNPAINPKWDYGVT